MSITYSKKHFSLQDGVILRIFTFKYTHLKTLQHNLREFCSIFRFNLIDLLRVLMGEVVLEREIIRVHPGKCRRKHQSITLGKREHQSLPLVKTGGKSTGFLCAVPGWQGSEILPDGDGRRGFWAARTSEVMLIFNQLFILSTILFFST